MATDSTKNNEPTDNNPEPDEPVDATPGASKAGAAKKAADDSKETSEEKAEPSLEKSSSDADAEGDKSEGAKSEGDKSEGDKSAKSEGDDAEGKDDGLTDDESDDDDDDESDDDESDDDDADGVAGAGATTGRGGFAAGSLAVVSAGLGLASIVGTSLSDMLRSRKELIGQLEGSSGTVDQQIDAFYGTPWHTTAMVNGIFALLAVAVGGVLLAVYVQRADSRSWVKSVALGGVILGLIGLLVSTGMYFDLFAGTPEAPAAPAPPAQ